MGNLWNLFGRKESPAQAATRAWNSARIDWNKAPEPIRTSRLRLARIPEEQHADTVKVEWSKLPEAIQWPLAGLQTIAETDPIMRRKLGQGTQ